MDGVLSSGVERSSIGARPLVRVYSPRHLRGALVGAGFDDVRTLTRHFRWDDLPHCTLAERIPLLRSAVVQDSIGRIAGWYVVGLARKT